MKNCSECKVKMEEKSSKTPENIEYKYYKCTKCGEEIVDMAQLHNIADKYRTIKNYHVKLSKWGLSLGIRIPKEIIEKYNLKDSEEITLIPEEKGIKLIPIN